jgi:CRP-like cAMP-binding protein/GNAT superfamily N-acetyltransferase
MITVREAVGRDVAAIQDIFLASYGTDYTDQRYYDESLLTRLVYSNDSLILVAEDSEAGRVVGTASVDLEVGAHSDLVGEFGRLAVHPRWRQQGVGKLLMTERLRRVQERLQVGLVEARVAHAYSVKIAEAHQFAPVGFLPQRWRMQGGESLALLARHFGNALALRRNHPRILAEVYPLAHLALESCGLPVDPIVDETASAYPPGGAYKVEGLTTEGYAPLLRIARGRVCHREIFGPVRLHYGIFRLDARRSRYLIAREGGQIAGAVGFILDPMDNAVRVFELISLHDGVIRPLLGALDRACREEWGNCLIEVDVSAHAPRMQRTLLELGLLPVAYVPALVFDEVERLDVVKMLRLPATPQVATDHLTPRCRAVADLVLRHFRSRSVLPRVAAVVGKLPLSAGLDAEQVGRLAGVCSVTAFAPGAVIFGQGQIDDRMHVVLQGEVAVAVAGSAEPVGLVEDGECLGEMSLLTAAAHSATATARTHVETAVLEHEAVAELIRLRPDIGLHIYRNLAVGLGQKLKRLDVSLPSRLSQAQS